MDLMQAIKKAENLANKGKFAEADKICRDIIAVNDRFHPAFHLLGQLATQAYLKMAAIELWDHFPKKRDQLVNEARTILKIGTKKKLQKLRENFVERHDVEISKSKSPLSVHKKLVKDLIENHGYRSLKDFT